MMRLPASCPGRKPCGHTILEHLAWENGYAIGQEGGQDPWADALPFPESPLLQDAWLFGRSAGGGHADLLQRQ